MKLTVPPAAGENGALEKKKKAPNIVVSYPGLAVVSCDCPPEDTLRPARDLRTRNTALRACLLGTHANK